MKIRKNPIKPAFKHFEENIEMEIPKAQQSERYEKYKDILFGQEVKQPLSKVIHALLIIDERFFNFTKAIGYNKSEIISQAIDEISNKSRRNTESSNKIITKVYVLHYVRDILGKGSVGTGFSKLLNQTSATHVELLGELFAKILSNRKVNLEETHEKAVRDTLAENYGNISQTAIDLGVTRTTVYKYIKKYGIKTNYKVPVSPVSKEYLKKLIVKYKGKILDIADELGVHRSTVDRYIKRYGLKKFLKTMRGGK